MAEKIKIARIIHFINGDTVLLPVEDEEDFIKNLFDEENPCPFFILSSKKIVSLKNISYIE